MFDFLKKKISGLVDRIAGKPEQKKEEPAKPREEKVGAEIPIVVERGARKEGAKAGIETDFAIGKPEKLEERAEKETNEVAVPEQAARERIEEKIERPGTKEETAAKAAEKAIAKEPAKSEKVLHAQVQIPEIRKEQKEKLEAPVVAPAGKRAPEAKKMPEKTTVAEPAAPPKKPHEVKEAKEKPEEKVKLSLVSQVKSLFSNEVELGEKDVKDALSDFELELLEADVAYEVAEQIKDELEEELVGKKVRKTQLQEQIANVFLRSIRDIMAEKKGETIEERLGKGGKRPVTIMFTGPNGSGKTTTIAKIARMLKNSGYGVVIAAADTFRAAAIEQMEIHGQKLGIRVIKGKYGADPTSVAYDAVNHAKAHGLDVVLVDTAGRQETNQNLLNELKKMVRVINPEIKLYVGESLAGNAVIEQVQAFNQELKLDGIVLTKLDCDAKGGTVISISRVTKVPVVYVTTGQGYGDIEVFDADKMAKGIAG